MRLTAKCGYHPGEFAIFPTARVSTRAEMNCWLTPAQRRRVKLADVENRHFCATDKFTKMEQWLIGRGQLFVF